MTHDDFFRLAVDPVEPPTPAQEKEIREHRAECSSCRERERDYFRILEAAKTIPDRAPPVPSGLRGRVLAAAHKAVAEDTTARKNVIVMPQRQWKTFLMAASVGIVMFGAGGFAGFEYRGPTGRFDHLGYKETLGGGEIAELEEKIRGAKALYKLGYIKVAKQLAEEVKAKTKIPAFVNDAQSIIDEKLPR